MESEKAKSSHFDRTRGFKNQIFPTYDVFERSTAGISSKCSLDNYHVFLDLSGVQILMSNGLKVKGMALKILQVLLHDEGVKGRVNMLDAVL